jgi:hypothetical protein
MILTRHQSKMPRTCPSPPPPPPKPIRRRRKRLKPEKKPYDIFIEKKTLSMFNVKSREEFEGRIARMQKAVQKFDVNTFFTSPHETRTKEAVSASNAIAMHLKLSSLTLSYAIAAELYAGNYSWGDCCTEAANRLTAAGQTEFAPVTVKKWNKVFREHEKIPHPHESERDLKPVVFRNYPHSEEIAFNEMMRLKSADAMTRGSGCLLQRELHRRAFGLQVREHRRFGPLLVCDEGGREGCCPEGILQGEPVAGQTVHDHSVQLDRLPWHSILVLSVFSQTRKTRNEISLAAHSF